MTLPSWNRDLANDRAVYMGKEYRKKGVNMILGPVVGPLGRVALGGRNWEGYAADPYLSGILVAESVKGFQSQNVATSLKVCLLFLGLLLSALIRYSTILPTNKKLIATLLLTPTGMPFNQSLPMWMIRQSMNSTSGHSRMLFLLAPQTSCVRITG